MLSSPKLKNISRTIFALYLLTLLWLVLFKFSLDFSSVLQLQMRGFNFVPLAGHLREMFDNFIVFVPFGLLLGVTAKHTQFLEKLAYIFIFSLAAEALQFILAIGVTDVTDLITNTLGGFACLALYSLGKKYIHEKKLDTFIIIVGSVLLVLFLALRFFVFRIRY